MKGTERDAIEELAQLLDGELTVDEATAPVRELATLATTVTAVEEVPRPTPAFRAALRNELTATLAATPVGPVDRVKDAVWDRTARWRNSVRVAAASAVASTVLGSAGVAVAAQQALPGDLLYGVKQGIESLRVGLASGLIEQGRVHLSLAEERLDEIADGVTRLEPDQVIDTLEEMDDASVAGADALLQAVTDGADRELLTELSRWSDRQRTGLAAVYDELPAAARPFADTSFEVLRRIEVQAALVADPCAACQEAATGGSPSAPDGFVSRPGEGPAASDGSTCDCVAPVVPPPARDPGVRSPAPVEEDTTAPVEEPETEPQPDPEDDRVVVPPLPGPLDPIGQEVDDAIEDLLDPPTVPTEPGDVDDIVEDLTDSLEDTTEPVAELTEPIAEPTEPVGDATDLLDPLG